MALEEDTDARSVVVTGASTGIGWATAKVLTGRGITVYGSVRRQQDAERLREELGERAIPLVFDVLDEGAVRAEAGRVQEALQGRTLFGLVNNAGIAVAGPMLHVPVEEHRRQLEVNLVGPVITTQAFAPLLGADRSLRGKPGRIVNVGSVGGKLAAPFLGSYAASKHGMEGMNDSLRRELMLYGIDVIIIEPGAVATPIWNKGGDPGRYDSTEYGPYVRKFAEFFIARGLAGLPPERVGELICHALTAPKPRARYAILRRKFRNLTLPLLLPPRLVDRKIAKQLGWG